MSLNGLLQIKTKKYRVGMNTVSYLLIYNILSHIIFVHSFC